MDGNLVPGSLNSSKKLCAHASNGVILDDGVYSNSLDTKSIADSGVRCLKTYSTITQTYTHVSLHVYAKNMFKFVFVCDAHL